MNDSHRRVFMRQVAAGGVVLLAATSVRAQPVMVSEKDATAVALGYVSSGARVDPRRFPRYTADQKCGNCQLFTGRPGDAVGGCGIFTGKMVAAIGWCSAHVPKA